MNRPAATRKFGEKREAIVQAAAVLINEVGVQATTLAEVARAIGLNATSVTYYFPRKEQLVVAVYDQTLTLMENIAREALAQDDPAARLRHFIAAHVTLRQRIRAGEHGLTTALSEIRTLEPEVQRLQEEADAKWQVLLQARQRREALDKLKEKQQAAHLKEGARTEQKAIDEMVVLRAAAGLSQKL